MQPEFWHNKWKSNELGFHQDEFNPFLVKFFDQLQLNKGDVVFVPLCGKTRDIAWLLQQGYQVIGIELVETAVKDLFADLAITPEIRQYGELVQYEAENLTIYAGDFFQLTQSDLESIKAIYDRAAIVALPESMRQTYCSHLLSICNNAPQLLISFDYDQSKMDGPPFSVPNTLIKHYYQNCYQITLLESTTVEGGLKGNDDVHEQVWLLS
jgi:thiopurine S-methyltransferase